MAWAKGNIIMGPNETNSQYQRKFKYGKEFDVELLKALNEEQQKVIKDEFYKGIQDRNILDILKSLLKMKKYELGANWECKEYKKLNYECIVKEPLDTNLVKKASKIKLPFKNSQGEKEKINFLNRKRKRA